MNLISQTFHQLKQNGRKAFIPYIMGGDPGLDKTADLIEILSGSGADMIEVGVPFSDPVADGPVIQQAGVRSLQNGCTFPKLLACIKEVKQSVKTPIILMIYYNMIYQRGLPRFFEAITEAGCAGLIIPDLPFDEAAGLSQTARQFEIALNFLTAPTSADERIRQAGEASTGFLYAVSLKGTTGMRSSLPPELPEFISRIKCQTERSVAVGFGISTPDQAKVIAGYADGVIIGSVLVKAAASNDKDEFKTKVSELRRAI